jgi:hypothetical protein
MIRGQGAAAARPRGTRAPAPSCRADDLVHPLLTVGQLDLMLLLLHHFIQPATSTFSQPVLFPHYFQMETQVDMFVVVGRNRSKTHEVFHRQDTSTCV